MRTCDDGHDEVAYDNVTRDCPVCVIICEIDDLKVDIEKLEEEIVVLTDKLEDAKNA